MNYTSARWTARSDENDSEVEMLQSEDVKS